MTKIILELPAWWTLGLFAGGSPKGTLQIFEDGWMKFTLSSGIIVFDLPINKISVNDGWFDTTVTIEQRSYHLQFRAELNSDPYLSRNFTIRPILPSKRETNKFLATIKQFQQTTVVAKQEIIAISLSHKVIKSLRQLLILNTLKFVSNVFTTVGITTIVYNFTNQSFVALIVGAIYLVFSLPTIYLQNKRIIRKFFGSLRPEDLQNFEDDKLPPTVVTDQNYYNKVKRKLFIKISLYSLLIGVILTAVMFVTMYLFF